MINGFKFVYLHDIIITTINYLIYEDYEIYNFAFSFFDSVM